MNMKKKDQQKGKSVTDQICDIDNKLLELLAKRSELLKKSAQARSQKRLSMVDSDQEKKIWKQWFNSSEKLGLNEKSLKKIFHFANALGYQKAEAKGEDKFELRPTRKQANIDIGGPRDRDISRFWLTIAAICGTPIKIEPAILNDSNVELAKALNMADGNFSWEKSGIIKDGEGYLNFDHKLVFVGGDSLNFYILACLAVLQPGYCKFTGSSGLKVQNLNHVYDVLPKLGARAVPLVPGNEGLPIRVESSGQLQEEIVFYEDTPEEFIAVIGLCLPFMYETQKIKNLKLRWPGKLGSYSRLERVSSLLASCGIKADLSANEFNVRPGEEPFCPNTPKVPLDPALSAYVLIMVRILGGVVELQGEFPDWSSDGRLVQNLLQDLGVALNVNSEKVVATCNGQISGSIELDIFRSSELYPLCLAMGAILPVNLRLPVPDEEIDDFGIFLLEKIGVPYTREGRVLEISGSPAEPYNELNISVPDPWWGLAVALLALKRSNIVLENPGELTRLWPHFWHLYKGLPDPQVSKAKNAVDSTNSERPRRRRKVE